MHFNVDGIFPRLADLFINCKLCISEITEPFIFATSSYPIREERIFMYIASFNGKLFRHYISIIVEFPR